MARKLEPSWNMSRPPYATYSSFATRYTMVDLEDFVGISALSRENRRGRHALLSPLFPKYAPLYTNLKQLTDYQRSVEFPP